MQMLARLSHVVAGRGCSHVAGRPGRQTQRADLRQHRDKAGFCPCHAASLHAFETGTAYCRRRTLAALRLPPSAALSFPSCSRGDPSTLAARSAEPPPESVHVSAPRVCPDEWPPHLLHASGTAAGVAEVSFFYYI